MSVQTTHVASTDTRAKRADAGTEAMHSQPATPRRSAQKRLLVLAVLLGLVVALCGISFAVGARAVPLDTVWAALGKFNELTSPANQTNPDFAVIQLRIPRTVAAILVGACLGLAGTAMQGIARNPLADPGILGVNAGAAVAVIAGVVLFGASSTASSVWFAFAGAALAAVIVYAVASVGREGATPIKLALAGAALSAGLISLLNALLISNREALDSYRNWQTGSVAGVSWDDIAQLAPFMAMGALILLGTGKLLNALALGDDMARGLGQNVAWGRALCALGVVILCGAATAMAGPVAFVGLVVPHALRALIGADYRWLLPFSIVSAPIVLLSADIIGRIVLPPGEVPAGIIAVLMGAPVFIYLVRRRKAASL